MIKILLLTTLVVSCLSAPAENPATEQELPKPLLTRPAPINPDVPSEPKPDEKITIIQNKDSEKPENEQSTDEKPIPGPVKLFNPVTDTHQHYKRESPIQKIPSASVPASEKHSAEDNNKETEVKPSETPSEQNTALPKNKRDIPVPLSLPEKKENKQESNDKPVDDKQSDKKDTPAEPSAPHHPATFVRPVPVSQIFGNKEKKPESTSSTVSTISKPESKN